MKRSDFLKSISVLALAPVAAVKVVGKKQTPSIKIVKEGLEELRSPKFAQRLPITDEWVPMPNFGEVAGKAAFFSPGELPDDLSYRPIGIRKACGVKK